MKRTKLFLNGVGLAAAVALGFVACANVPTESEPSGGVTGPRFVLELTPGPEYRKSQIAAWVETPGGDFVETIYVTAKAGRGDWLMAPKSGRPEALPVWSHARADDADAATSATPSGTLAHGSPAAARLAAGNYVVWLEINRSFDYNEAYPKSRGVNGQPSVVYRADIQVGSGESETILKPAGTGAPDGSDGEMRPGLAGISTALELLSSAMVSYFPQ